MMVSNKASILTSVSATLTALTFAMVVASLTLHYVCSDVPAEFKNRLQNTISVAYIATFLFIASLVLNIAGLWYPNVYFEIFGTILLLGGLGLLVLGLMALLGMRVSIHPLP